MSQELIRNLIPVFRDNIVFDFQFGKKLVNRFIAFAPQLMRGCPAFHEQVYTCAADVTGLPLNTLWSTMAGLTDINIGKPTNFKLNEESAQNTREAILASAALPVVFEPVHIDGRTYYDGGLCDLLPLKALENCNCSHVFVVHCNRDTFISRESLPHAKVFEIVPQEDPGGLIFGTLNFTGTHARRLIEAG